jgi:energy-converting hydrogenase Eha subunit C
LCEFSTGLLEVVLGGNDVMVNTKVWHKVVFVMLVHISLELLVGGSLGLQAFWEDRRVASWDGFLLSELTTSILEVVLGGNNVVINTEIWDEVVFVVLVHIGLELLISSGLSFEALGEDG